MRKTHDPRLADIGSVITTKTEHKVLPDVLNRTSMHIPTVDRLPDQRVVEDELLAGMAETDSAMHVATACVESFVIMRGVPTIVTKSQQLGPNDLKG